MKQTLENSASKSKLYPLLSELFKYPGISLFCLTEKIEDELRSKYPEAFEIFKPFVEYMNAHPIHEIEELYLRTFDVQAISCLEVGYVLFGEDYKRGAFLVKMNEEHKKVGNDCGSELSDFLPNILSLLPKLEDKEFVDEFVGTILFPAIKKMIEKFKDSENVYKLALQVLDNVLNSDYNYVGADDNAFPTDFVKLDVLQQSF